MTLYWNIEVLQCVLTPDETNQWFYCDRVSSQCNHESLVPQYKMHLDKIDGIDGVMVESIGVIEDYNVTTTWTRFCSNISFADQILTSGLCEETEWNHLTEQHQFCLDTDNCNGTTSVVLDLSKLNDEAFIQLSNATETINGSCLSNYSNCDDIWNDESVDRISLIGTHNDYLLNDAIKIRCAFVDIGNNSIFVGALFSTFSLENGRRIEGDLHGKCAFYQECPSNQNNINLGIEQGTYRWNTSRIESYRDKLLYNFNNNSYLLITCNHNMILDIDYVLMPFSSDILQLSFGAKCLDVLKVNIRGHACTYSNASAPFWQGYSALHIDSAYSGCSCNDWVLDACCVDLGGEDDFGSYDAINSQHSCSSSNTSTTDHWVGSIRTFANCEELQAVKHINWNSLSANGGDEKPEILYNITASSSDLTLSIDLELDYLGYSYAGTYSVYGYGTTYHLGFYLFDGLNGNKINQPSNCDNRVSTSFTNKTWSEYWIYSQYPYYMNQIGNDNFLAYPSPSEHWTLSSISNSSCSKIQYSAIFTVNELLKCKSFDGSNDLIEINNDNEYINISGTFYVNIISPISKDVDINKYYVYQLFSYPFIISIKKTIHLLESMGIFLFTASIFNVGRNSADNSFNVIILTESAEYLSLSNPSLLYSPNLFSVLDMNSNCSSIRSFMCTQFWELKIINISCPFTLSGQYVLQFDILCSNPDELSKCNEFIQEQGSSVSLSANLTFTVEICDDVIWSFEYNANMIFYDENAFITAIADNHLYDVGKDRVFIEIIINDISIDNNGYSILDTKLLNVWLCTVDENKYGALLLDKINIDSTGCFSSNIDDDGPYHIILNYDELFTNDAQHEMGDNNNMVRFSFIIPNTISRDTLYIEAQIELKLSNASKSRRRRLVQSDDDNIESDQITHFMGNIGIQKLQFEVDSDDHVSQNNTNDGNDKNIVLMIAMVMVIFILLLILIIILIKSKCCNNNNYQHHQIQQQGQLNENVPHFPRVM